MYCREQGLLAAPHPRRGPRRLATAPDPAPPAATSSRGPWGACAGSPVCALAPCRSSNTASAVQASLHCDMLQAGQVSVGGAALQERWRAIGWQRSLPTPSKAQGARPADRKGLRRDPPLPVTTGNKAARTHTRASRSYGGVRRLLGPATGAQSGRGAGTRNSGLTSLPGEHHSGRVGFGWLHSWPQARVLCAQERWSRGTVLR